MSSHTSSVLYYLCTQASLQQYTFENYSTAKIHLKHGIFANIALHFTFNLAQENQIMAFIY